MNDDTVYIVMKYWCDPTENRNASGYEPVGYVVGAVAAKVVNELDPLPVSNHPWPMKNDAKHGEDHVQQYKTIAIEKFPMDISIGKQV